MQLPASQILPTLSPMCGSGRMLAFVDRTWLFFLLGCLFAGFTTLTISAQAPFPPSQQLQVFPLQGLSFGDFYPSSSGGTVTVDFNGVRTSAGVTLAGGIYYQAVFEVALLPGRLVNITLGPNVLLTGSNGGSMTLSIGPSDKGNSFVTSGGHPFRTPVNIGGTLTVGSATANPPGSYSGEFFVTFNQN